MTQKGTRAKKVAELANCHRPKMEKLNKNEKEGFQPSYFLFIQSFNALKCDWVAASGCDPKFHYTTASALLSIGKMHKN